MAIPPANPPLRPVGRVARRLMSAVCALAVSVSAAAFSEPPPPAQAPDDTPIPENARPCRPMGPKDTLRLDTSEMPLSDFVRVVSCALDRNLMLSPPTLGQKSITLLGPRPLDRRDLLAVWHAALSAHALIEERRGGVYLIRPAIPR